MNVQGLQQRMLADLLSTHAALGFPPMPPGAGPVGGPPPQPYVPGQTGQTSPAPVPNAPPVGSAPQPYQPIAFPSRGRPRGGY